MSSITAYFDGECRKPTHGSTGPGRAAWLIVDGPSAITELGETTNIGSEYAGLISLLEHLAQAPPAADKIFICGDADVVIHQVTGRWSCRKDHLIPLRDRARELVAELEGRGVEVNLVLIGRRENKAHASLHPPKRPYHRKQAGPALIGQGGQR